MKEKKYKCPCCNHKPIEDSKCPKCGNLDVKIPLTFPGEKKKSIATASGRSKAAPSPLHFICESELIREKSEGEDLPPHLKNTDILDFLPDKVKLISILGGSDYVFLNPSQIISEETLFIEKVQFDIRKVFLSKKKNVVLKKNGIDVTSENLEITIGDKLNIESMLIYLEVS